jgi:hypothetical protein
MSTPLERDPVVEAYKKDVDRTLLRANLRKSVAERIEALIELQKLAEEARRAGKSVKSQRQGGE